MFKKDELAARLQNPAQTLNRLYHSGDGAQRESAHNGIDAHVC